MLNPDHFVGGVAVVLGMVVIAAALFNWPWCYKLTKIRWLEAACGRRGARLILALLGVALVALGCAIAAGLVGRRVAVSTRLRVSALQCHRVSDTQRICRSAPL